MSEKWIIDKGCHRYFEKYVRMYFSDALEDAELQNEAESVLDKDEPLHDLEDIAKEFGLTKKIV